MNDDPDGRYWHIASAVVGGVLSASFSAWAWIVNTFGKRHLARMDALVDGQVKLHEKVDSLSSRVSRLEGRMDIEE